MLPIAGWWLDHGVQKTLAGQPRLTSRPLTEPLHFWPDRATCQSNLHHAKENLVMSLGGASLTRMLNIKWEHLR